jgi:hypothetical protein
MNLHKYCTTEKFNYYPFVSTVFQVAILSNIYSKKLKQKSENTVNHPVLYH